MIDFSTLKELYVDGKKVTSLFLDGHEVPVGEPEVSWIRFTTLESSRVSQPFTVALSGSSTAKMDLLSSYDGKNWGSYANNTWLSAQSPEAGQTIYFKAASKNERASTSDQTQWHFVTQNAAFKLGGDLKYLLDPTGEETSCMQYGFRGLFENNFQVHDISELSITLPNLGQDSCKRLFAGCSYLSVGNMYIGPQLPVNNSIQAGIFSYMFAGSQLTSAPELFSLSCSGSMYYHMFDNCASLSTGPYVHSKTSLGTNAYAYMFVNSYELTSLSVDFTSWYRTSNWLAAVKDTIDGIFTCPSALGTDETMTRGPSNCPTNWRVANYDVNGYDMHNAFIRGVQTTAFLEDGSSHVPDIAALSVFNGQTAERLYDMTQYTVQLPADTTTAGTKTIQFNGTGVYFGSKELSYRIIAKNLSSCTATVSSVYDNDEVTYIEVVQPDVGYTLVEGTDYTVAVSTSGDQSTVTITGIGSWTGTYTTTVAHKTSGTTPLAIYKHDPNDAKTVNIALTAKGISRQIRLQKKPMSDPNASWTSFEVSSSGQYAADSVGFWVRALNENTQLGDGDNSYYWINCGYGLGSPASVDLSGDIVSLIDRSQTISAITANSTFNSTFQNNDKIVDASRLSCSAKTITATDRAIRRLFGSRGSGFGAESGYPQILTAIPEFEGLSVTTGGSYVYLANFQRCTALTSVTMQIPWPLDSAFRSDIANQQFVECTGLVSAVVKSHFGDGKACPDNYLANIKMLDNAFSHCTSLSCISTDLTAWPGRGFTNWLADVAATGTFICPTALGTDATIQRGNSYCPTGWTVVNYDA